MVCKTVDNGVNMTVTKTVDNNFPKSYTKHYLANLVEDFLWKLQLQEDKREVSKSKFAQSG
jgi:hypothetical protein